MNLLLLSSDDFIDSHRACVRDYRFEHLKKIHKVSVGEQVRVGLINGAMGQGEVVAIESDAITLVIDCNESAPPPLPLTLVLALPRPQMLKRCLQTIATLGVKELYLIGSQRVEKSFWSTPVLYEVEHHLRLGLEQGIDTMLPNVHLRPRFKPFVEDELPSLCSDKLAWVAHPGDYPACPREAGGENLLVIGPEGGLLDYEVELLVEAGCKPIQIGPRILRVETAVPVLISRFYPY